MSRPTSLGSPETRCGLCGPAAPQRPLVVVFVPFERARVRAVRACTLPIVGTGGPFLEARHGTVNGRSAPAWSGACQSPASCNSTSPRRRLLRATERTRPGASAPTRARQRPRPLARLAMIERIGGPPRRPETVAPSLRAPRKAGLGYRISGRPMCQAPLVTVICLACVLADLGTVTVNSPSRKQALICSASTSCGSAKERLKAPLRRSRIT